MTSAIGDQLRNPAIKPAIDGDAITNTERYIKGIGEGLVDTAEMLDLPAKGLEALVGHLFSQSGLSKLIPESVKNSFGGQREKQDELIKALREKTFQPEGATYGEKFAREAGKATSGLALGAGGLARSSMRTLGNVLAMGGGAATQAASAPAIQEMAPNDPWIQIPANILSSIPGMLAGGGIGKMFQGAKPTRVPEFTAGQMAPMRSPESRELLTKQINLAKNDKKTKAALSDVQQKQQGIVNEKFDFPEKIEPSEFADEMVNQLENIRSQDSQAYQEGLEKVMTGYENPPELKFDPKTGKPVGRYKQVKTEKAFSELEKIKNTESKEMRDFADKLIKQIEAEEGNPVFLNSLKKQWGSEASAGTHNPLHVGKPKQAIFKKVIHGLTEDMKEQIPGYADFMENTAARIEKRNAIIDGVVGDYMGGAEKDPSKLFKKIFENPNKKVNEQIRELMPEDTYNKAAQSYLSDLFENTAKQSTRNQENLSNNYYSLAESLHDKRKALDITLPEDLKMMSKDVVERVMKADRGVPRNEYTINTGQSHGADAVKKLGTTLGLAQKAAGKMGVNYLNREEMLTGVSPGKQIKNMAVNPAIQTGIQGNIANELSQSSMPPSGNIEGNTTRKIPVINPAPGESNYMEIGPPQNQMVNPMEEEDREFMAMSNPQQNNVTQENEPLSEDMRVLQEYEANPFVDEDKEFMNFVSQPKKGKK